MVTSSINPGQTSYFRRDELNCNSGRPKWVRPYGFSSHRYQAIFTHSSLFFTRNKRPRLSYHFRDPLKFFSNEAAEGFVQRSHDWHLYATLNMSCHTLFEVCTYYKASCEATLENRGSETFFRSLLWVVRCFLPKLMMILVFLLNRYTWYSDHDWHHNTETKTSRLTEFLLAVFTTKSENAVTPVGLVLVAGHRASPSVLTRLEFLAAVLWIETDQVHSLQKGWFGLLPRRISFDKRCRKKKYEHSWHMQRLHYCKRRLICPKELPLERSLAWTGDLSYYPNRIKP